MQSSYKNTQENNLSRHSFLAPTAVSSAFQPSLNGHRIMWHLLKCDTDYVHSWPI